MGVERTIGSIHRFDGSSELHAIHSIGPKNILSFGPATQPLALGPLNVLIGPNGSGKSNLLEVIALLKAAARDKLRDVIVRGGGADEWIWKGEPASSASVDVVWVYPQRSEQLRHVLSFASTRPGFRIEDERIELAKPRAEHNEPAFFYRFESGRPLINLADGRQRLLTKSIDFDRSILAQRRDPEDYPEITRLAELYDDFQLYREWSFGRGSVLRQPQKADLRSDRLKDDFSTLGPFSNLALFLNRLRQRPKAKAAVLNGLKDLYEGVTDFDGKVEGGTIQVFFTEGDFTIPATRLSDGTVRYLCLLAILCDPEPPPLVAIEEPELGLHPDIIPKVADLMVAASQRTQIIATTHSDILVDALTERPESVVIVEKHNGASSMTRLDAHDLSRWLTKYRLGQLWTRGELGGTRW